MAYNAKSLVNIGPGVASDDGASNLSKIMGYRTGDAPATVEATGYFNAARNRLTKGTLILAMCTVGGTPVAKVYIVTAAPASGNVTITHAQDTGGVSGAQTALADNSGGNDAAAAIAAGAGKYVLAFFVNLAEIADGDLVTNYVPGHRFKILKVDFRVGKAVTTGSKAADINLEIGTTNLSGGVVALTSAACTPKGAAVAGTSVTANNVGTATDSFSIEAANTVTFVEGNGWILVSIQNLDTADALASLRKRAVDGGLIAA